MTPETKIAEANKLPITEELGPFAKQFDDLINDLNETGLPYLVLIGTARHEDVDNANHQVAGLMAGAHGSSREVGRLIAGILSTQSVAMQAEVLASIVWSLKQTAGFEQGSLEKLKEDSEERSSAAWPSSVGEKD